MMKLQDLGALSPPLIICGGAYGNVHALDALIARAGMLGIGEDSIIHTGDAIAYCADGRAAADRLAASRIHAIAGNVETQLGAGDDDCGCGFDEGSACDVLSKQWYAHAAREIGTEQLRWIASLPDQLAFEMAGRRFRVIHGGVAEQSRFLFASSPIAGFKCEIEKANADCIVAGHCGLPFTRLVGERIWHNSGALGMPANDGTARVWYSLIEADGEDLRFSHHTLGEDDGYDPRLPQKRMRDEALPEAYANALTLGLWPSLDVLPATERAATGKMISLPAIVWPAAGG